MHVKKSLFSLLWAYSVFPNAIIRGLQWSTALLCFALNPVGFLINVQGLWAYSTVALIAMPLWMKVSAKFLKCKCKLKRHSSENKRADPEPYAMCQKTLLHVQQQMCQGGKVKEDILFVWSCCWNRCFGGKTCWKDTVRGTVDGQLHVFTLHPNWTNIQQFLSVSKAV